MTPYLVTQTASWDYWRKKRDEQNRNYLQVGLVDVYERALIPAMVLRDIPDCRTYPNYLGNRFWGMRYVSPERSP